MHGSKKVSVRTHDELEMRERFTEPSCRSWPAFGPQNGMECLGISAHAWWPTVVAHWHCPAPEGAAIFPGQDSYNCVGSLLCSCTIHSSPGWCGGRPRAVLGRCGPVPPHRCHCAHTHAWETDHMHAFERLGLSSRQKFSEPVALSFVCGNLFVVNIIQSYTN